MKKYILKIAGLISTTTALVTTIACSSKAKPPSIKKVNLESLLSKFIGVKSTQTKAQITTILKNKNTKNTPLDVTILKSMGFTPPPHFRRQE